ncbi:hypothetical protein, partial [Flavobacterium cyanobacteriorum]|uniref:hypothetical protein n=1 Tax=Flavobacterium cyanobacteriorum TaxID=2022802 RepID=UPI001A9C8744
TDVVGSFLSCRITFCVLPQLAISEHFTVTQHKSLIGALSYNFARHRQLRQHAVTSSASSSVVAVSVHLPLSWCVGLVALLIFLFGFVRMQKSKCATKSVG